MCAVMATRDEGTGLPIGEVLKRTRTRRKVDIHTVEQQTKIRTKYLRALENEEWDVLPGRAYAKGFLRTYAQFLGLDGDALVDEYRRTVEAAARRRPRLWRSPSRCSSAAGDRARSRGAAGPCGCGRVGALAAAGVVAARGPGDGGSDEGKQRHRHNGKHHAHHHGNGRQRESRRRLCGKPVTLALVTRDDMEVCLVTGDGRALIDAQTLIAGANEGPFQPPADNYRLDLDSGGAVTLTLDGKHRTVRLAGRRPATRSSSDGVRPTSFKGPSCP